MKTAMLVEQKSTIMTWNVNGFASKKFLIETTLREERVAIALLQETLSHSGTAPLCIAGYNTFSNPREEGFRGQAVLVDERLPCYRIPHDEKSIIHVKISQWNRVKCDLHVISVYFPSGGNKRRSRTIAFNNAFKLKYDILRKNRNAMVFLQATSMRILISLQGIWKGLRICSFGIQQGLHTQDFLGLANQADWTTLSVQKIFLMLFKDLKYYGNMQLVIIARS
jgi:hypothetical protein